MSKAIFSEPNCTKKFSDVNDLNVEVMKGRVMDGVAPHMTDYFRVDETQKSVDVAAILERTKSRYTDQLFACGF